MRIVVVDRVDSDDIVEYLSEIDIALSCYAVVGKVQITEWRNFKSCGSEELKAKSEVSMFCPFAIYLDTLVN